VTQMDKLRQVMRRLRDPGDGCPWDLAQDYRSIAPSTLEEAYEVVEAIETEDYIALKDELGDLMFQVIFYSQLASEEGRFDLDEVLENLVAKLLRRHPHVFPTGDLESRCSDPGDTNAIKMRWEAIKTEERKDRGIHSLMDDVPLGLPALTRAQKLQKRASSAGFDWSSANEVMPQICEELTELEEALAGADPDAIREEYGDFLFSAVNLGRKLGLDCEQSLRAAARKFEYRFRYMEQQADIEGKSIQGLDLNELEKHWREAKQAERI
jgi:nucleoside triphosphate diphosphatase